jgi:hypothetical protein
MALITITSLVVPSQADNGGGCNSFVSMAEVIPYVGQRSLQMPAIYACLQMNDEGQSVTNAILMGMRAIQALAPGGWEGVPTNQLQPLAFPRTGVFKRWVGSAPANFYPYSFGMGLMYDPYEMPPPLQEAVIWEAEEWQRYYMDPGAISVDQDRKKGIDTLTVGGSTAKYGPKQPRYAGVLRSEFARELLRGLRKRMPTAFRY